MTFLAALFVPVFKRLMRRHDAPSPLMGWLTGLSFFVILPLYGLALNGGYSIATTFRSRGRWADLDLLDPSYFPSFLVIWLTLFLTALTLLIVLPKQYRIIASTHPTPSTLQLRTIIITCCGILLATWIFTVYQLGGLHNYLSLHWYGRLDETTQQWGGFFTLTQHASGALKIILTAATALFIDSMLRIHSRQYIIPSIGITMLILNMIMTGNRIYIALLLFFIGNSLLIQRKFRLIAILLVALPFLAFIFGAWSHVRGGLADVTTSVENYQNVREKESDKIMGAFVDATEASNVILLFHITKDFGPRYDFLYGATYLRAFTFPIPRSIYPDRTKSFTVISAELYIPLANTSLSSTALGEMYANFGIFTVFLLPAFTLTIFWISNRIMDRPRRHTLLSAILFMIFAWMARSVFAGNFITLVFCIIIIIGLRFEKNLVPKRRRNIRKRPCHLAVPKKNHILNRHSS